MDYSGRYSSRVIGVAMSYLDPFSARLEAAHWCAKGEELYNQNRLPEALQCFDRALELDPVNKIAWMDKGNILDVIGQPQAAIRCYDAALEIDPSYDEAWYNKGYTLQNLGFHRDALECYDRVLFYNENHIKTLFHKGYLLITSFEFDKGLSHLLKAEKLGVDISSVNLKEMEVIYGRTPKNATEEQVWVNELVRLFMKKEADFAKKAGTSGDVSLLTIEMLVENRRLSSSGTTTAIKRLVVLGVVNYETFIRLENRINSFLEEKKSRLALGGAELGLQVAKCLENTSILGRALFRLGEIHWRLGNLEPVLRFYEEAAPSLESTGQSAELETTLGNLGDAYCNSLAKYEQAIVLLNRAININLNITHREEIISLWQGQLGLAYSLTGKYEEAAKYLELAVSDINFDHEYKTPLKIVWNLNLGSCYSNLKMPEKSIRAYTDSLSLMDENDYFRKTLAYYSLCNTYNDIGQYENALEMIIKARELWCSSNFASADFFPDSFKVISQGFTFDSNNKSSFEAEAWLLQGKFHRKLDQLQESTECFDKAKRLAERAGHLAQFKTSLELLANNYLKLQNTELAIHFIDQALSVPAKDKEDLLWAYHYISEFSKKYIEVGKTRDLTKQIGNKLIELQFIEVESKVVCHLGTGFLMILSEFSQNPAEYFLLLSKRLSNRKFLACLYASISEYMAHREMSAVQAAFELAQQAYIWAFSLEENDVYLRTTSTHILARIYKYWGKLKFAAQLSMQAQSLLSDLDDNDLALTVRTQLGGILLLQGNYQQGIEILENSLGKSNLLGVDETADTMLELGLAYIHLEQYEKAENILNGALAQFKAAGNLRGEAACRGNLGICASRNDVLLSASEHFEFALSASRELGRHDDEVISLYSLGAVSLKSGKFVESIEFYNQALDLIYKYGFYQEEAITLTGLGQAHLLSNQPEKARIYLEKALEHRDSISDTLHSLSVLARYFYEKRNYHNSNELALEAVELYESIWFNLNRIEDQFKYIEIGDQSYDIAVKSAIQLAQFLKAFELAERAKTHTLNSYSLQAKSGRKSFATPESITRLLPDQNTAVVNLYITSSGSLAFVLTKLNSEIIKTLVNRADFSVFPSVNENSHNAEKESILKLSERILLLNLELLGKSFGLDEGKGDLPERVIVTDDGLCTISLPSFSKKILERRERMFITFGPTETTDGRIIPRIGVGSWELATQILPKDQKLPGENWLDVAEGVLVELRERLFWPILTVLKELGISKLILIPHYSTSLAPLQMMRWEENGTQVRAIDRFEISFAPSCTVLQETFEKASHTKSLANNLIGISNPNRDLPFAELEISTIASMFGKSAQLILSEDSATSSNVVSNIHNYSFIHFGCHAKHVSEDPYRSYMSLAGQDQSNEFRFTVGEVLSSLNLSGSKLAVISACESAFTESKTAEYLGIPGALIFAGAPSVISSLWEVDDLSTAFLMGRFYENILITGMELATALRESQLWLRTSTAFTLMNRLEVIRKAIKRNIGTDLLPQISYAWRTLVVMEPNECPFSHPFFWAPFILVGYPGKVSHA
jgi:CHAT domain-containing protein/tetratricopeptide (TPR) repeat protein